MERIVRQAAMKRAQEETEKKYKELFPKETREEKMDKKQKSKTREIIKDKIK